MLMKKFILSICILCSGILFTQCNNDSVSIEEKALEALKSNVVLSKAKSAN